MVLKVFRFRFWRPFADPKEIRITWLAHVLLVHVSGSPMFLARPCFWLAHVSVSPMFMDKLLFSLRKPHWKKLKTL